MIWYLSPSADFYMDALRLAAEYAAKWRDPRVAMVKRVTATVAAPRIAGRYNARNREGRDCVWGIMESEQAEVESENNQ
jgi:hypothetical protein